MDFSNIYLNFHFLIHSCITLAVFLTLFISLLFFLMKLQQCWRIRNRSKDTIHIAFFHPYCNSGGGGERVLWTAIKALQKRYDSAEYYIYTGDEVEVEQIMDNVRHRFKICMVKVPTLISLKWRWLVEAQYYPFFTLLGQSIGSVLLSVEAILKFSPDIVIETTGYAFTYPVFKLISGSKVASYTHYPTISCDMLSVVSKRSKAHNNREIIARSKLLSNCKLVYYKCFAMFYGFAGRYADVIMVNSSWTYNHILELWQCPEKIAIVYPPCDLKAFETLELVPDSEKKTKSVVSIGQFRPEKNYPLQLRAFKKYIVNMKRNINVELVLIGGVRNESDKMRVTLLKQMAEDLQISDKIRWCINAPFSQLLEEVRQGSIGLHSMWNEHFGISVVECMAGGLIMLAHDSGGPKEDIVNYSGMHTGYLASTEEDYAHYIDHILNLSDQELEKIRSDAKISVRRFSEDIFEQKFLGNLKLFFTLN